MSGIVGSKLNIRGSGRIAKLGTDGQVLTSSGAGKPANYEAGATSYDDDAVRDDIATLALHQATDSNSAKYNLVNTSVDQFEDSSGVSAFTDCGRDSSGEFVSTVSEGTQVDFTADGTWTRGSTTVLSHILLVAGGGGGGYDAGGGGGAGGLVYTTDYAVSGTSYAVDIGGGGAYSGGPSAGTNGEDTTFIGDTTLTAKGGGGGGSGAGGSGTDGGSGGGAGGGNTTADSEGVTIQSAESGVSGSDGFGFDGVIGASVAPASGKGGGGGGGAGGAPTSVWTNTQGSNGGAGKDMSATFGTGVGDSGWFSGGAGAGSETNGATSFGNGGDGELGGGGRGGGPATGSPNATAAVVNSGGGGGGGKNLATDGGSGFLSLIPQAINASGNFIANDSTALASVSSMGIVMTYKDESGTNTLNTDIIAEVSADGGSNYTTTTLVAGGTFSTGILQAIANDVVVTAGTAIRYRISFANQSVGSLVAQIYGVSLMY